MVLVAMATSRSRAVCVVLFLGLLLVGCQGQLLEMRHRSAMDMMSLDPRRILADTPYYISYGSLDANRAPCPSGQAASQLAGTRSRMSGAAPRSPAAPAVERPSPVQEKESSPRRLEVSCIFLAMSLQGWSWLIAPWAYSSVFFLPFLLNRKCFQAQELGVYEKCIRWWRTLFRPSTVF